MATDNKQTKKIKNSTLAIDQNISNRLDLFCKKNAITKKDFIALALDYFDRTGVDIYSNDMVTGMDTINEKIDALFKLQADTALKVTTIQKNTNLLNEVKDDTSKLFEQRATHKKSFFNRFKRNQN